VLLVGLLLCFSVTFLLLLRPSTIVCALQRFSIGMCFSIVYAALLTKTNRIQRIFNSAQKSNKQVQFISPQSQLVICGGIVVGQVFLNIIWLVSSPPQAIHHYPTRYDNFLVCRASIDLSYMITFSYPIFLVVICTVYAVLTRKIPEAFNESKFIGFSMYTTCVIWLAFVPIYISTTGNTRTTSMSITISLSAMVCLVILFSPKLYIILLHPEKNIRAGLGTAAKYKKSCLPSTQQNGTKEEGGHVKQEEGGHLRQGGEGGHLRQEGEGGHLNGTKDLRQEEAGGGGSSSSSRANGVEARGARQTSSVAVGSNQGWGLRHRSTSTQTGDSIFTQGFTTSMPLEQNVGEVHL